jgi:N-carbamoylputrescine amidase
MKVTVCELSDDPNLLAGEWEELVAHVKSSGSELVLLPEMPFYPWWMLESTVDLRVWDLAIAAHESWQRRLDELLPAAVLTSFPVRVGDQRLNEGILWEGSGRVPVHHKYYLPDEAGFRESTWYHRGDGSFSTVRHRHAVVGFLICSELWSFESARHYGSLGANVIATPRATRAASLEKWIVAGRAAAMVSGAFLLSSNRRGAPGQGIEFAGTGWIIDPEGRVVVTTSKGKPFVTVEIDLEQANQAKRTYPRNLFSTADEGD